MTSPARRSLARLLPALAADPRVRGAYLGGSLGRGEDDDVSDLDMWVRAADWTPESIGSLFLTGEEKRMNGIPFVHGVSVEGSILDILHGPDAPENYVPLELPNPMPLPLSDLPPCGLVETFWMMSLKHRKSLWRGQEGILTYGLHHDHRYLLRAWALHDTGTDPGEHIFTIYALRKLYDQHIDAARLELLGLPLRNRDEIVHAVQAYRDEMSRLFPGGSALESLVRSQPLLSP